MLKNKTKGVTLDELATMIANGFEQTATKIDLEEVKQGVSGLKSDMTEVNQKVSRLDYRVEEMHEILARFEEGDILDLQKRIKILERTVKALVKQVS